MIVPDTNESKLEILEWSINGEDQCPACGEKSQLKGLISGGNETSTASWPWHLSLWKRSGSTIHYICGGSVLNKKWTISAGIQLKNSRTCVVNQHHFSSLYVF